MLKAMANLIRPAPERRTTRHNKSRSPLPFLGGDELQMSSPAPQQHHQAPAATIPTRSSSRTSSDDRSKPNAKATKPVDSSRPGTRKRAAASTSALADATPSDARPPTKVTVTQPHGQLLRITNGVPKQLGIEPYLVPSGASTPKPNGAGLAVPTSALQPQPVSSDKRSLRSHDGGSRLKSDLATYFSSYDDIIAGVEKAPEYLEVDTPIYIVDEPLKNPKAHETSLPESSRSSTSPSRSRKRAHTPTRRPSHASLPASQSSTAFQVLDYSTIATRLPKVGHDDPLGDSVYFAQHRRAERKEKQLRNIEKERAMHEKVQLERLLDNLQGPDWLKVMGITGVTDGERKEWEPKRDFFIKEVELLVDKFRLWKEQEKKLKVEKEAAQAVKEDDDDEEETESEPEPKRTNGRLAAPFSSQAKEPAPPKPRKPPQPHGYILPPVPIEPAEPFTSFFSKPHLRAAALGKHRHGRNALAFGLPIPEFEEREFELPEDFVTPEFLRDNARKRRRRKRESGAKS